MSDTRPKISVILPIFQAREWINSALSSLVRQTLPRDEFEVLAIFNGPDDGSKELVHRTKALHPGLQLTMLTSSPPSASIARNIGVETARGEFVTFLDADDWLSDHYLELMLQYATSTIVPIAQFVNIDEIGRFDRRNQYNNQILGQPGPVIGPKDFSRPLSFMASKVFPMHWAKEVPFNETLRSSEDVDFNYRLYARYDFEFALLPAAAGATYYRRSTPTSVSRGDGTKDFLVEQRLEAMAALISTRSEAPPNKRALLLRPLNSQLSFISEYFKRASPEEQQQIRDALVSFKLLELNWSTLQCEPSRLVIAPNFAPSADTGAIVTGKRIRSSAKTVDVISNDLSLLRDEHKANSLLSAPYINRHKILQPSLRKFASEEGIYRFIDQGLKTYQEWTQEGTSYNELYSRSMWPHSHLLAAAIKRQDPKIHWEAEFSDPNSLTVEGKTRLRPPVDDEIHNFFKNWGSSQQQELLDASPYVMRWAELLPYIFADSLVFTNRHQLTIMLENAPAELRPQISEKSTISVHPTLPQNFYDLVQPKNHPPSTHISLAYFGDFYRTRGMTEVFEALDDLSDEQLNNFHLGIFTSSKIEEIERHIPPRVLNIVKLQPKIQFFEFLATLKIYDVVIVNDADTKGHFSRNPYLPSKISDYRGAETPVWAVVEPGSILSSMVFSYTSYLGDKRGALKMLRQMITDHSLTV